MMDEGVGTLLIERLSSVADRYESVDFIDAGTGGLSVLHLLEGRRKVIFIDCALMDAKPGAIKRFTPEDVSTTKVLAHQSLHEADLMRVIEIARELGQCPDEIVIFGIQPGKIEQGTGLTERLLNRLDDYMAAICKELSA